MSSLKLQTTGIEQESLSSSSEGLAAPTPGEVTSSAIQGQEGDTTVRRSDELHLDVVPQVAPEIIELDFSDGLDNAEFFIAQKAVLGGGFQKRHIPTELEGAGDRDRVEVDLLERIYRLCEDNWARIADIRSAKNPEYIMVRLKGYVKTLETVAGLYEELDRHRHGILRELILQCGIAHCPVLRNQQNVTLEESDELLDAFFLDQVKTLSSLISEFRHNARILNGTEYRLLRGTDELDRRFGPDRRDWEEKFLSLISFAEAGGSKLRQKMLERRSGFGRVSGRRQKTGAAMPSTFAVAKDVPKATKAILQ